MFRSQGTIERQNLLGTIIVSNSNNVSHIQVTILGLHLVNCYVTLLQRTRENIAILFLVIGFIIGSIICGILLLERYLEPTNNKTSPY